MSNSLSNITQLFRGFPGSSEVKNLPAKQETQVPSLEKKMATHPSIASGLPDAWVSNQSTCSAGDLHSIPGSGGSPEKEMATHSSMT